MKIEVKVIPGAKRNFIKKDGESYKIYLTAPAAEGKANKALLEALSEKFDVPKRKIEITKGLKSRHKTVRIND